MKESVTLLGSGLRLEKGDQVIVTPATNQPVGEGKEKVFVRPPYGRWRGGLVLSLDNFILVDMSEVEEFENPLFTEG